MTKPRQPIESFDASFNRRRIALVILSLCLIGFAITIRAVVIHLFPPSSETLANIAHQQYKKELSLSSNRGSIFDRKKEALAIAVNKPSLVINPRIFNPNQHQLGTLSQLLHISPLQLKKITTNGRYFAWLKRKVSEDTAQKALNLNIGGLYSVSEPKRHYPGGAVAAQLLGFVGRDNRGLMGLERKFDALLKGPTQTIVRSRDALGRPILFDSQEAMPESSGHDLHLTIDSAIQEISEKALASGVKAAAAMRGFAIVSDPHTGRILAMANYPSFDPNADLITFNSSNSNHAVMDLIEPGSVTKSFVIAEAIERGLVKPADEIYCENGTLREGNWQISDDHPLKTIDIAGILIHSSNICAFKVAKMLEPEGLYSTLTKFGFGSAEFSIDFPGQAYGKISKPSTWLPVRFANISFGQGFVVTGIEMIQAYGAIANGGNLIRPFVVDRVEAKNGNVVFANSTEVLRKVISPKTARIMRNILRDVVEKGTGRNALMKDYSSAGKTGTSEKIDPLQKAYTADKRIASFVGFAPSEDPYLVIYVVVDEPNIKPYYGGTWAAPIFKEIAENALHYLNVAPDKEMSHKIAEGL